MKRLVLAISVVVALGTAAGVAYGTGSRSNNLFHGNLVHGCYKKSNGNLRVHAAPPNGTAVGCKTSEKPIFWVHNPVQGPAGPAGPAGSAGPAGPSGPSGTANIRAGQSPFLSGTAGFTITFSPALPDTNYSVSVQPTNTGGYSTTSACTYFNILNKTASGFDVQHKRCDDGVPVTLDTNISLDWIAIEH